MDYDGPGSYARCTTMIQSSPGFQFGIRTEEDDTMTGRTDTTHPTGIIGLESGNRVPMMGLRIQLSIGLDETRLTADLTLVMSPFLDESSDLSATGHTDGVHPL